MSENWKPVVGYEGIYSVSDLGRVRRDAPQANTYAGRILRPSTGGRVYHRVNLCKGGKIKRIEIYRLVAAAFIGPQAEGMEVNHKDGNKQNSAASNLEYVTPGDNARHAVAHNLWPNGEKCHFAKLDAEKVAEIRAAYARGGVRQQDLADRFGITQTAVSKILRGATWKSV